MVQSEIVWQHNDSTTFNPANAASIALFNAYFGGGMGSLVFQTIRESKALAYSTYANYNSPSKKTDPYSVVAYVGCQADKYPESIIAMNELLHEMPASDKLLQASKESILKNIETQRTTKTAIFFKYDSNQRLGLAYDINQDIYSQIPNMTSSDLMRFYSLYMKKNQYNYCIVAKRDKLNIDGLKKLGEFEEISLDKLFGY